MRLAHPKRLLCAAPRAYARRGKRGASSEMCPRSGNFQILQCLWCFLVVASTEKPLGATFCCELRQAFLEQHTDVELHAEAVLHFSQGLEAQQRVPAHLEEPVIAANRS